MLFHGKNSYLSLQEAKKYIDKLLQNDPSFTLQIVNAEKAEPDSVVQSYQNQGLFSPQGSIVFIKRLYKNPLRDNILADLSNFLQSEESNTEIILWEDQKIPSNTRYLKFFKARKELQESVQLNKRSFVTWGAEEAKQRGLILSKELLYQIATASNFDPERFINDLTKIRLYKKKDLNAEDVSQILTNTFEHEIWDLIDSINSSNLSRVASVLGKLIKQGVDPNYMLALVIRNIRQLIMCKDLLNENAEYRSIASTLRIPPFTVSSIARKARETDQSKLENIYKKIYSLDYEIKTGNIDPALGITLLATII
ncbi:DNA polymerase III subunit delta [Candidatus Dojkabacteria bacterium]|uniref:DNA-directed DNA polymerase n=1 Tax=Candidatus Dojkabacteria bacterium TaxID=2099670 RepID=A0A955HXT7_9BACT|nr:DNA polymerase III subunit delta [Candidatus Dojkabacteria bacterium]MCB9790847.1 DNA polymerase III subunit delta [Candidatus Nomurabacteria bacterium]